MRILIVISAVLLSLCYFSSLTAQTDTSTYHIRNYDVKLNKIYYIVTMDNEIIECVFIAVNTDNVLIKEDGESETVVLEKSSIKRITVDYPEMSSMNTFRPIKIQSSKWCFGGGAAISNYSKPFYRGYEIGSNNYDNAGKYSFGYQFFANYTAVLSSIIALRTDFEYSHEISGEVENYGDMYYTTNFYTRTSGGSFDEICVKLMLGAGNFLMENDVTINVFAGFGAGMRFTDEMTFYSNTAYYGEELIKKDPESQLTVLASVSMLIGYRPWKKAGIFLEPQLNIWGVKRMPVQLLLRTGIML